MFRMGSRAASFLFLLFLSLSSSFTCAADPNTVATELAKLDQWLATSDRADGWNRYLRLDQLRSELERDDAVDTKQVESVLMRFQGDAPALQTPEFVRFAQHLAQWHHQLQASTVDGANSSPQALQTLVTAIENDVTPAANVVPKVPAFEPITDAQLESARTHARKTIANLERFLAKGTPDNVAAWKAFLTWDVLQQQLASGAAVDTSELGGVIAKFYSGENGLELPRFVEARRALLRYHRLATARQQEGFDATYQQQVDGVLASLKEEEPDVSLLATRLNWLEQLGQAPEIVAEARARFQHPNLHFRATADMIARQFVEPVSQTSPVNEMILGTHVRGTAHLTGTLSARLVPSQQTAMMELVLNGSTRSNTLGWQSPVTIRSIGHTGVHARKLVVIDPFGLSAGPASVCCNTSTTICSISAGNRLAKGLIEKVAWKRAAKTKSAAEREASRKAERRIATQFNASTNERLGRSNDRLENKIRRPLQNRNLFPRIVSLWTTAQQLNFAAVQALDHQLAAPNTPPAAPEAAGMSLQIHESMVLNSAINLMSGYKLTDVRAQKLAKRATGSVPEELQIKQDEDPWSITFDVAQPVRVDFDDNRISFAIRGREFTRGDDAVRKSAQIGATYEPTIENGRLKLVRTGDVEVTYPGREGKRLSLTELRNKTFLTNKFEGIFKSEIGGDELKLDGNLNRLNKIKLAHVAAKNGWLTLTWE